MKVLVINAGSSSLKYQLLDPETGHLLAKGLCERIGIDGKFTYKPQVEGKAAVSAADVPMPTHSEAIQAVLSALVDPDNGVISSMKEIDAVGHRVVHGGESFASSVLITDQVMQAVEDCIRDFKKEVAQIKEQMIKEVMEVIDSIFGRELELADKSFMEFRMSVNIDSKNIPVLEQKMVMVETMMDRVIQINTRQITQKEEA